MIKLINHKSIKHLGQVFLKNDNLKQKIANLINNSSFSNLLEIGPGLGAITAYIDFKRKNYWAVEIDESLVHYLNVHYPDANVHWGDFLEINIDDFEFNDNVLLFGNIPYYISTPILLKFLKTPIFEEFYLMVQKEFFDMLNSKESTKKYSSFSVLIQTCCQVTKLFDINRLNFFPKPKIDSIFFGIKKKKTLHEGELEAFAKFLRICFAMPRKTLFNNLRKVIFDLEQIKNFYQENDLLDSVRPKEISPDKYRSLFQSKSCKELLKNFE